MRLCITKQSTLVFHRYWGRKASVRKASVLCTARSDLFEVVKHRAKVAASEGRGASEERCAKGMTVTD